MTRSPLVNTSASRIARFSISVKAMIPDATACRAPFGPPLRPGVPGQGGAPTSDSEARKANQQSAATDQNSWRPSVRCSSAARARWQANHTKAEHPRSRCSIDGRETAARNILDTLAQGWQAQGHHVQPVEQI